MTHLGTQIAALVDGQLQPAAAERALCHVAGCPECAAELAAQRSARAALASAAQVPVADDLAARLLALGTTPGTRACAAPGRIARVRRGLGALRARIAGHGAPPVPMPTPRAERAADRACLRGTTGRAMLPAWAVVAVVGVAAVWLFAVGEEDAVTPVRHPAQALSLLAAAEALAGQQPDVDAELGLAADGVPTGYEVVAVQQGTDGVEIDLDGPYGAVVVTRQYGRLDPDAVAGLPVMEAGGHDVHVLSRAPWHLVWQSGDTVVSVVAGGQSPAVEAVATAYPEVPFDDGVDAQISRGWAVVAGSWTP